MNQPFTLKRIKDASGGAENTVTARKLEGLVRNAGDAVPEVAAGPADPGFPHSSRLEARLASPGPVARFFTAESEGAPAGAAAGPLESTDESSAYHHLCPIF